MVIVRLVTLVCLNEHNLGRFMLFVVGLLGLFFVAMLSIVSLFVEERMTVMRMKGLFQTVGMVIAMVGMGMRMRITEIVGVFVLVGVSVLGWRSLVRMDDVHPRFAQVALKRVRSRFVAIGTILTRLLILVSARKIDNPT